MDPSAMLPRSNDALRYNPPTAQEHITTHGSDFFWAVFAVMGATAIFHAVISRKSPVTERVEHYISIAILSIAAIAYYTMASNLGNTPVQVEFHRGGHKVNGNTRSIFYARYIDWFLTTPLLLLQLLLLTATTWSGIIFTIWLDMVMILTGLFGALVSSRYKWGYFAFGCAAMLFIYYQLFVVGRKGALEIGEDAHKQYTLASAYLMFIWMLYPIAWGLCEGGNVISPDSEAVFYGVLDILAKPVFSILIWRTYRTISLSRLGLAGNRHFRIAQMGGATRDGLAHKNDGTTAGAIPVNNGTTSATPGMSSGAV